MKRPMLDMEQRQAIRNETFSGAILEVGLAYQHTKRTYIREYGYISWLFFRNKLMKIINYKLFGRT